jgi:hypothetical protein
MFARKAVMPGDRTLAGIGLTFLVWPLLGAPPLSVRAFARASLAGKEFDE